jgi:photosystem II stability/assembly factor-like uncharacterized protein
MRQAPAPVGVDWSNPRSFWKPLERNAFLRLPLLGNVRSLQFTPDGRRGWAIVDLDDVMSTDDGGLTWTTSSDAILMSALVFADDGMLGWVIDLSGLRRTTDGGVHWEPVKDPVIEGGRWTALAFDGAGDVGVIFGADGAFATSVDGGRHWSPPVWRARPSSAQQPGLNAAAWSGDGQTGWIVGGGATVLVTKNGGRSWERSTTSIPPDSDLVRVQLLADGLRGWAVSAAGDVYASDDGGSRWRRLERSPNPPLSKIFFLEDGKRGWALSTEGQLLETADGGARWQRRPTPFNAAIKAFAVRSDGARIWIAGGGGIAVSDDHGVTWQANSRDATATLSATAFAGDGLRGWAVGQGGAIIHTQDGGASWTGRAATGSEKLNALAVHGDGLRAWAVGDNGTLELTVDGGIRWKRIALGIQENLLAITFSSDGRNGVVLGRQGLLLLSSDGGLNWRPPRIGIGARKAHDLTAIADKKQLWVSADGKDLLYRSDDLGENWAAVANTDIAGALRWGGLGTTIGALPRFSADGNRAWWSSKSFGSQGLLVSDDGGQRWRKAGVPGGGYLEQVPEGTFLDDGLRGWAVRRHDMYSTSDSGHTWQVAWDTYRRLPALWYWFSLLPAAGLMILALRQNRAPIQDTSAASMFADDDAISAFEDDRLEFGPLARGLSRFLRNPKTSPPLTLAITGDWGTGKSSLMRLLSADLERYGQRPIWFNAWHHQKDEEIFSALLGTIRAQAAPSSLRPAGWIFRLKLLWLRSKRHAALSFVLLTVTTSVFVFPFQHSLKELGDMLAGLAGWARLVGDRKDAALPELGLRHVGQLAQLLALATAARLLYKGMQAFGVDPALMVRGVSERFSLKRASAQNSFRTDFAQQFGEVAQALPYRMTIIIDDLDRCRPENILDVLETVNFLTASGQCFVVFGMATERVVAALSMSFEKVSAELGFALPGNRRDEPLPANTPEAMAKAKRRAYALDYLEKLINLEIMVPARGDIAADALFRTRADAGKGAWRSVAGAFTSVWPLYAAAIAIGIGIMIGSFMPVALPEPAPPATPTTTATAPPTSTSTAAAAPPTAPSAPSALSVAPEVAVPAAASRNVSPWGPKFIPGQRTPAATTYGPPLALGFALLLVFAGNALLRLRTQAVEVRDSEDFKNGLKVWTELAAKSRDTPRAIKRWGNRLRYFAMLQQGSAIEETRGQRLRRRFAERIRRRPAGLPGPAPRPTYILDEARLIAIGAAHEAYGKEWRTRLDNAAELPDGYSLKDAINRHHRVTGKHWEKIKPEEAEAFERLLAGIKLPPARVDAARAGRASAAVEPAGGAAGPSASGDGDTPSAQSAAAEARSSAPPQSDA